jgi:hypothetical protein
MFNFDKYTNRRIMDAMWIFSFGMIIYIILFNFNVKNYHLRIEKQKKFEIELVKNFELKKLNYICSNSNLKISNEYLISKDLGWEIYNSKYFIKVNKNTMTRLMRIENCKLDEN